MAEQVFSPADFAEFAAIEASFMPSTATVKTKGSGGDFSVTDTAALPCRLDPLPPSDTLADRAERARRRVLVWGLDYAMPNPAQVVVGGRTWNVVSGTRDLVDPLGQPIAQSCDVALVMS